MARRGKARTANQNGERTQPSRPTENPESMSESVSECPVSINAPDTSPKTDNSGNSVIVGIENLEDNSITPNPDIKAQGQVAPLHQENNIRHRIINRQCAGMKIGARTGIVSFDDEGMAIVGKEDYELFMRVPGYTNA